MRYDQAIAYLRSVAAGGSNLGLDRVRRLLARLGNPQDELPCVHVGGTNGKGSVSAMLTAMLVAGGYRVGTFTSPHLSDYTERFRINGTPVARERLARLVTELRPVLDSAAQDEHPTEFEIHTVLALRLFREERVDVAVVEVGLGGRLDATNVVQPLVSVITNVTRDHTDYLGESLEEIAGEKAGIIKTGVPVVTAAAGAAARVIEAACREKGSPLLQVGREVRWTFENGDGEGRVSVCGPGWQYRNLALGLRGPHQAVNAACAVTAAALLRERGFMISDSALRAGLERVRWPGRFEILHRRGLTVVLDAAHNAAAAEALRATLRETFPRSPVTMLLGILADKEREKVVAALAPLADRIIVTRPPTARAGRWREVAAMARRHCPFVHEAEDHQTALEKAIAMASGAAPAAGNPSGILLITGSIYLLGPLRDLLTQGSGR